MRVLITGASSGIGRDLARAFAKRGYDLVLIARNEERLNNIKNELENMVNIETELVDVSSLENCVNIYNKYTNIDILVNNAGFGDCGYFDKTNLDKEMNMIDTNIKAYHILMKLYLENMIKKDSGRILNVASIAGFMPGPLMATYYATKSYVVRLSEAIREELKKEKSNVQISILCPGPVATNFNKTANVKFKIREANSEKVAEYTVKKLLKGKFYIVPGLDVKIARIGAKLLPTTIISKFAYMAQKRKLGGE